MAHVSNWDRCGQLVLPAQLPSRPMLIKSERRFLKGTNRIMSTQAKCWCFTLNNYKVDNDGEQSDEFRILCEKPATATKYAVVGKEVGESGTPIFKAMSPSQRLGASTALKAGWRPGTY